MFGILVRPLYLNVSFLSVCSYTYTKKMKIEAVSVLTSSSCQYLILAPNDSYIELNFTDIHGFLPSSNETLSGGGDSRTSSRQHLPEVVIKEKLKSGRDRSRAVICRICRIKTNQQAPQVFHSDSNSLNITYTWIPGQESGFTLNIDFHQKKSKYELSPIATEQCTQALMVVYCMIEKLQPSLCHEQRFWDRTFTHHVNMFYQCNKP